MDKIKIIIHKLKPYIILFLIILFVFYTKAFISDYLKIWPSCHIGLDEFYPGDNTNAKIIRALNLIEKENREDFKYICKNIHSIEAKFCDLKHMFSKTEDSWHQKDGCYIKGGEVIYLNPEYIKNTQIPELAQKIKYLSDKKKKFDLEEKID